VSDALPPSLRDLAAVIGASAAQRLVEALGGVEKQYIPKRPKPDHALARLIGWDGLQALAAEYGGHRIDIPRGCNIGGKKRRVAEALDRGASPRQAALLAGCTGRHARQIRADLRADPVQRSLFDDP